MVCDDAGGGEITRKIGAHPQERRHDPACHDVGSKQAQQNRCRSLREHPQHNPADWRSLIDPLGLGGKTKTRFGKLSGGQKQRLSIALALVGTPQVAVLDELTTGLDPAARRDTWELIEGVRDRGVTIVLVTHFMEEAEWLCDRVALLDSGRVVAIDTPANLAEGVDSEQRIQFRPSVPLPDGLLEGLPDVTHVIHRGDVVVVTGNSNALNAVTSVLARNQIVARQLRVDQASLEDAFLALVGPKASGSKSREH